MTHSPAGSLKAKGWAAALLAVFLMGFALFLPGGAQAEEANTVVGCDQNAKVVPPAKRHTMTVAEFSDAAKVLLNRCHMRVAADHSVPSLFRANLDFPETLEGIEQPAFLTGEAHPTRTPERYLNAVLAYVMAECGADHVDWDGVTCNWFHAPWMHDLREPMRGLTRERSSRLGELHPSQTERTQNWAVGMYNNIGGHAFHKIWKEAHNPNTKDFVFDNGTVAVKLLFSLATPEQVPYLRYAKTWEIFNGEDIVKARLMQVDVLVKDDRVNDDVTDPDKMFSGWVMGSFLYNGSIETTPRCDQLGDDIEACEQARWRDRLMPIGLQWGNDPDMYNSETLTKPVEHWLGDGVTKMFEPLRLMGGHPAALGRDGRMNGPVDNHRSTCLACHSRAVDFGRYEEDHLRLIPFVSHANPRMGTYSAADLEELKWFFRNLKSDVPFLEGTHSLDYSLQAAVGVHHFRKWVDQLPLKKLYDEDGKLVEDGLVFKGSVGRTYRSRDQIEQPLRLAAWNIANLHHETGVALRSGAAERKEVDFERLAQMATKIDADLIALQEIGSPQALARIFPADQYHLVMSDRYTRGDEYKDPEERDIYTAFAFRKSVFNKVPKVVTVDGLSMPHTQWDNAARIARTSPTRAGLSVEFEMNGKQISLLNVHLKSSCNRHSIYREDDATSGSDAVEKTHEVFACRTLRAQLDVLENWLEVQVAKQRGVVVMGDFNRQMNWVSHRGALDEFWLGLNETVPTTLVKGPVDEKTCWVGHKKSKPQSIDFIVAQSSLMSAQNVAEIQKVDFVDLPDVSVDDYPADEYFRLSDHCPVVGTLPVPTD